MTEQNTAQAAEAEGKTTVTVEWRDLTPFEAPLYYRDMPFEAVLAADQGRRAEMAAALLPPDVLVELLASKPTMGDIEDLLETVARARGFGSSGESPASAS